MTEDRLKDIQKVLESIDGCLSISVSSCEKCVHGNISHPKCKNLLIRDAQDIINELKERSVNHLND